MQSSCIPTSCSIVSVAGDLPLKVMEGHSEISRDDAIEPGMPQANLVFC